MPQSALDPARGLTTRFLNAVARIERTLKERHADAAGEPGLGALVRRLRTSPVVAPYERELLEFAQLRNTIVHNPYVADIPIAAPLVSTVERIEQIAGKIASPATVRQALEGRSAFRTVSRDDLVHELLPQMLREDFSQLAVHDDGPGATILTTNTIARWAASCLESSGEGILPVAEVGTVLEFAERELVRFVRPTTPAANILAMFSAGGGPRAVLVTPTGTAAAQPVGILVAADLPRLHALV